MASQDVTQTGKWHKNYTRLMPYYYVNKKAKLVYENEEDEEKLVRVRKVIKSLKEVIIEVAEKIDPNKVNKEGKSSRKRLLESSLRSGWDEIEEISYQTIKTSDWTLIFIR